MTMSEFQRYHPVVNFVYFLFAVIFGCMLMHPAYLAVTLLSGIAYVLILKGGKKILKTAGYIIPLMILTMLINPAFNHAGATILAYLPSGNPFTLESLCYGIAFAVMLAGVLVIFICFNEVMTSDKLIYLFGRAVPVISLMFSMTLNFIPQFAKRVKSAATAQKCLGRNASGNILKRAKNGLIILSAAMTASLENAVDTANSMKARGYGLHGRTAFSIYDFTRRDAIMCLILLFLGIYTAVGTACGEAGAVYFPTLMFGDLSFYGCTVFSAYALFMFMPVAAEFAEVKKWLFVR